MQQLTSLYQVRSRIKTLSGPRRVRLQQAYLASNVTLVELESMLEQAEQEEISLNNYERARDEFRQATKEWRDAGYPDGPLEQRVTNARAVVLSIIRRVTRSE